MMTGMEPDQRSVDVADMRMNDEWKPKCPRGRGMNFVAVLDRNMQNSDKGIALVICAVEECQTVISALPYDAVWDQ